jgi:hypothetical protein
MRPDLLFTPAQERPEGLIKRMAVLFVFADGLFTHAAHRPGQRQDHRHPILVRIMLVSSNLKQRLEEFVIPGVPEELASDLNRLLPVLIIRPAERVVENGRYLVQFTLRQLTVSGLSKKPLPFILVSHHHLGTYLSK